MIYVRTAVSSRTKPPLPEENKELHPCPATSSRLCLQARNESVTSHNGAAGGNIDESPLRGEEEEDEEEMSSSTEILEINED